MLSFIFGWNEKLSSSSCVPSILAFVAILFRLLLKCRDTRSSSWPLSSHVKRQMEKYFLFTKKKMRCDKMNQPEVREWQGKRREWRRDRRDLRSAGFRSEKDRIHRRISQEMGSNKKSSVKFNSQWQPTVRIFFSLSLSGSPDCRSCQWVSSVCLPIGTMSCHSLQSKYDKTIFRLFVSLGF